MKRRAWFLASTFAAGWICQAIFLHLSPAGFPVPQWLLLIVMALGGRGRVHWAMGLGFLWGLLLDTYGVSLFGTQAWLLMAMGAMAGLLSKKINMDKPAAQATLTFAGTALFLVGQWQLTVLFHPAGLARGAEPVVIFMEFGFNVLAAPSVFWGVDRWMDLWGEAADV